MISWIKFGQLDRVVQPSPTVPWSLLTYLTYITVSFIFGVEQTFLYKKSKNMIKKSSFIIFQKFSLYINIYSTTFSFFSLKYHKNAKKEYRTVEQDVQLYTTLSSCSTRKVPTIPLFIFTIN